MNILITGAGLIGCHAARQLLEKGHQVVLYELSPHQGYIKSIIGGIKSLASGKVRERPYRNSVQPWDLS